MNDVIQIHWFSSSSKAPRRPRVRGGRGRDLVPFGEEDVGVARSSGEEVPAIMIVPHQPTRGNRRARARARGGGRGITLVVINVT